MEEKQFLSFIKNIEDKDWTDFEVVIQIIEYWTDFTNAQMKHIDAVLKKNRPLLLSCLEETHKIGIKNSEEMSDIIQITDELLNYIQYSSKTDIFIFVYFLILLPRLPIEEYQKVRKLIYKYRPEVDVLYRFIYEMDPANEFNH